MTRFLIPTIFDEIDELCQSLGGACQAPQRINQFGISISEDDKKIYVDVPVPGVKAEDVEVTFDHENLKLLIKGEAKQARENVTYHINSSGAFSYQIPVSKQIDPNAGVEAICKEGILSLTLSKSRSSQPFKIEVKVA